MGLKAPRSFGWLTNPKKAAYNRIYSRTTRSGCMVVIIALVVLEVLSAGRSLGQRRVFALKHDTHLPKLLDHSWQSSKSDGGKNSTCALLMTRPTQHFPYLPAHPKERCAWLIPFDQSDPRIGEFYL